MSRKPQFINGMIQDEWKFSWKCWFFDHIRYRRGLEDQYLICKRCGSKERNNQF